MHGISEASILVIDYKQNVLVTIKKMIKEMGINNNVTTFSNPENALGHIRNHHTNYNLILCDTNMPKMSGFELIRQVRRINSSIPIILMTSFELRKEELEQLLPSLMVNNVISKPFTKSKLHNVLKEYLH